ncbi:alpha/beta fold hydrolase [Streptomyces sp. NBC_01171]|uniref:alpha/beta fold hydrolase n=1 Tax=Streptomyces sp. NBC_01171 TaxID=2903757 RepID=UPI00386754F5|nr:alpha/beta hydrolase [Streptomyces sp. NBC_01171]
MVTRRFVGVGGVRLAYRVWGPPEGPPLVLLPALGEVSGDWDTVAAVLARGRRVYAVDLRGHGHSGWPGAYSLELMRADVLGFLDALGLDRIDLVGHSMGGIVAYLVASAQPGRVDRLVLEDIGAPYPRPATTPERPDGELPFDWAMVRAVRRQIDTPPPEWSAALGGITASTLILAGGPRSHIPQESVTELARLIPDTRLRTIPVGHLIHREAPEAFTGAVSEFLGGPSAGR